MQEIEILICFLVRNGESTLNPKEKTKQTIISFKNIKSCKINKYKFHIKSTPLVV